MTSMTGNGVKPRPLEVFPKEVWLMILDKLPHGDQFNCYHASAAFHDLLWGRRVGIMSPLVLQLLDWDYQKHIYKHSDLLNSRQVCRLWRRVLDEFCERVPLPGSHSKISRPEAFFEYNFNFILQIADFQILMKDRPKNPRGNPFISRNVWFDDGDGVDAHDDVPVFWNSVARLIDQFGKHIWYCRLIFNHQSTHEFVCQHLLRVTRSCPNLRTLTVVAPFLREGLAPEALFVEHPLSLLPRLVYLRCDFKNAPIKRELLRSSVNPDVLEDLDVAENPVSDYSVVHYFTMLKRVKFALYAEPDLADLQCVPWPLVKASLRVSLAKMPGSGRITFTSMFVWLSTFGDTLQDLNLTLTAEGQKFGNVRLGYTESHLRLRLPILTKLCITSPENVEVYSLDFVEEMGRLQDLTVRMRSLEFPTQYNHEERIQFAGLASLMVPSNIWTVLPELRHLFLEDRCSGYRYRKRKDAPKRQRFTMERTPGAWS